MSTPEKYATKKVIRILNDKAKANGKDYLPVEVLTFIESKPDEPDNAADIHLWVESDKGWHRCLVCMGKFRPEYLDISHEDYDALPNYQRDRPESEYRGVTKTSGNRWTARISHKGERIALGNYPTSEEAAQAYDRKQFELHGWDAWFNFPDDVEIYATVEQRIEREKVLQERGRIDKRLSFEV